MDIHEFQTKLFQKGEEYGFSEMEIYFLSQKWTSVDVLNQMIEEYNVAESGGLSFRGMFEKQMGYSFTEKLDEASLELLLHEAKNNAKVMEASNTQNLFAGSEKYADIDNYSEKVTELHPEQLIDAAIEMERIALSTDPRIQLVEQCGMSMFERTVFIVNSKGLHCHSKSASISCGLTVIATDGNETSSGWDSAITLEDFSKINISNVAKKAVEEAVSKLGATSIETDVYPIIFRADVAETLLGSIVPAFSGETAQQGMSRLQDKLGQQVFGDNITIVDDPLMAGVPGAIAFDDEGYATKRNIIVENGKFLQFLHNRETAAKAGTNSTGNAAKYSYQDSLSVSPHNLYLNPGTHSLEELIEETDLGIMIVELHGTNAGIDYVSGDFSLSAIGFLINEGKIERPVNQITVSGNLFELWRTVTGIANDQEFKGTITSPSIKVEGLTVSGI